MAATELQLGPRIRSLRQARQVTLRELAERAGVTESFLSQVEREVTSPSIASVQRIARALDLGIAELFVDEPPLGRVVRRADRRRIVYPGLNAVDEFLTVGRDGPPAGDPDDRSSPAAGPATRPYTHESDEEVVIVLEGAPRALGRRRAPPPRRRRFDHLLIAPAASQPQSRSGSGRRSCSASTPPSF